jgi:hypothetical protein
MVLDPLGPQDLRQRGHLLGCGGEDVLGQSTSYISDFTCFLFCCTILILSRTQEHFCLAESVSLDVA